MRKIVSLFILLTSLSLMAKERTSAEMRALALDVFKSKTANCQTRAKGPSVSNISVDDIILKRDCEGYSVFTHNNKGFVIVSKDADDEPILGYSATGNSDDDMPEALKSYLDAYNNAEVHASQTLSSSVSAIEPFVTTTWGQGAPFNNLCPEIKGKKVPCGCGATALSQILNYLRVPERFYFSSTYTVEGSKETKPVSIKDSITYPFRDSYEKGTYTDEEANAIATFVRDCGYAINMDYSTSGSGAYQHEVAVAAMGRLGFPKESIKNHIKKLYSDSEWRDLVYGELEKGYPIYYGGNNISKSGGHAFVVCGRDKEGRIYVNWGWDGKYNGYFSMSLLNPGNNDFSYYTQMVSGFHPEKLPTDTEEIIFGSPELYSFITKDNAIRVVVPDGVWNYSNYQYTVSICGVAKNIETGAVKTATVVREYSYATYYGSGAGEYPVPLIGLPEGKYLLSLAVREKYNTPLIPVRTIGGIIYYELTIDADGTKTIGTEPIATGVKAVTNVMPQYSTKAFNLAGQQVGDDYKGIIISNGKKILVK